MTQFSANESALISIITWVIEGFGGKRALGFLLKPQKSRRAEKKIHNARSLQENNARSAANQSARTIVAIIKADKPLGMLVEHSKNS